MSLKDVRRHHQSRSRSNDEADSADVAVTSPGQETAAPGTDGRDAETSRCRVRQLLEPLGRGFVGRHGRRRTTRRSPPPSRVNSSRLSAESRLSHEPAHQTTAWCFARVSATYASRRSSPRCSSTCCCTCPAHCGPSRPTSIVRWPAASWKATGVAVAGIRDRLPEVGVVDDRELEALAAVHRQHLDRLGVALQPAAALLVAAVLRGLEHSLAQPGSQRGRSHLLGHRRGVEQLADVAEVGHPALSVDHREQAGGQALLQGDRLHQRRDALRAQHPRPVMQAPVHLLPGVLVGGGDLLGRPAEDRGQGRRAGARRIGGPLDRLEHAQPLAGRLGAEDAAGAVDDGGNVDRLQRVSHRRRVRCSCG